jgi:hypothetical protein
MIPHRYLAILAYTTGETPISQLTNWFLDIPSSETLKDCLDGCSESIILVDTHTGNTLAYSHYDEIIWIEQEETI